MTDTTPAPETEPDASPEAEAATKPKRTRAPRKPKDAEAPVVDPAPTAPMEASAAPVLEVGTSYLVEGEVVARLDIMRDTIGLVSYATAPGYRMARWVALSDLEALPEEPTA